MRIELTAWYDNRPADKLRNARKFARPNGRPLSKRDIQVLIRHAQLITPGKQSVPAYLVSFHTRRRRSLWQCGQKLIEVRT